MTTADERIAVIGLGYVGLPLGLGFHEAGVEVLGIDADVERLAALRDRRSPIADVSADRLARALDSGFEVAASIDERIGDVGAAFVCVPTPLTSNLEPDLTFVLRAAAELSAVLRHGQMVILQSTTYPGTTTGPFRQALEQSGLTAGHDFALAFVPERLSPGDVASMNAPRLVGGLTHADTVRAATLMRRLGGEVLELTSPDAAEMAKLLENVFRNVNIALVNQLALLCESMKLDVWEVINAAATKPFGFMPFWPGPGVGGHCIPVDPYYLSWRARQFGMNDAFVELAGDVNRRMPSHVVDLVARALDERGGTLEGARVGVIGVSFKANVGDTRNSPAGHVMAGLAQRGAQVSYHDPHVDMFADASGTRYTSDDLVVLLEDSDAVVVTVRHRSIDWSVVYERGQLIIDTVNSSAGHSEVGDRLVRLGDGRSR